MIVEQLIAMLQDRDPTSQVLIEGAADTWWGIEDVTDDENDTTVFLLVGRQVLSRTGSAESSSAAKGGE